jgi:hypothetical protein
MGLTSLLRPLALNLSAFARTQPASACLRETAGLEGCPRGGPLGPEVLQAVEENSGDKAL